jgi:murein L,D-transpeptidase YafK
MRRFFLLIAVLYFQLLCSAQDAPDTEKLYPANVISLANSPEFSQVVFLVDKSKRTLRVYQNDGDLLKLMDEYPSDIGKKNGDKEKANDYRTPVGIYFLQQEKTQPEVPFEKYGKLAFTTDYPNIFDLRVSKSGSGIWLHAVPDTTPLTRGSKGCVVVRNSVIQDLAKYIKLGQTPLLISESIDYLNKEAYLNLRQKYLDNFEMWRKSWQESDVDTYIKYYDSSFYGENMNYRKWYKHKKRLRGLYKYIKVALSTPLILRNKDQVVMRTLQDYESDLHADYGEKTIHAYFSDNVSFKIIREDWNPLNKDIQTIVSKKAYNN